MARDARWECSDNPSSQGRDGVANIEKQLIEADEYQPVCLNREAEPGFGHSGVD
jgi:hypothetical protein